MANLTALNFIITGVEPAAAGGGAVFTIEIVNATTDSRAAALASVVATLNGNSTNGAVSAMVTDVAAAANVPAANVRVTGAAAVSSGVGTGGPADPGSGDGGGSSTIGAVVGPILAVVAVCCLLYVLYAKGIVGGGKQKRLTRAASDYSGAAEQEATSNPLRITTGGGSPVVAASSPVPSASTPYPARPVQQKVSYGPRGTDV